MNDAQRAAVRARLLPGSYPFDSHFFERPGGQLHYIDEGSGGPPVVMVHGNPTWSFYYRRLIRRLSPSRRCLALDHIGCGLSDKPSAGDYQHTLSNRVADFAAWIDGVCDQPFDLVVHDWGGAIGLSYAVDHPERVRRIVAANTAAFPLPPDESVPPALRFGRNSSLGNWLIRHANLFARSAVWVGAKRGLSNAAKIGLLAPYDRSEHRVAIAEFVRDIPLDENDRAWDRLTRTAAGLGQLSDHPSLLVWGAKDFVFTPQYLQEFQRHWPQAQTVLLDDAGHYTFEDLTEQELDQVVEFLS